VKSGRVRQVAVPAAARALSTLSHVDYEDAFLVETGPAQDRTGEQWARAMLEDAPSAMVRRSTPDFALLGAGGRLGLSAELLFKRRQRTLLYATFVQKKNHMARALWAGIEPGHRPVVRYLLEQASRRERR
jgi:hypothetical protein